MLSKDISNNYEQLDLGKTLIRLILKIDWLTCNEVIKYYVIVMGHGKWEQKM